MTATPRGLRPHIILAGKRNCGKSSFLNSICGKARAIVSDTPGTTSDPVYINMELLPFGPVTFVDTPGLDDTGELGQRRVDRARRVMASGDLLIHICRPSLFDDDFRSLVMERSGKEKPVVIFTFIDIPDEAALADNLSAELSRMGARVIQVSNHGGQGLAEAADALVGILQSRKTGQQSLLEDLVRNFQLILMVVPIDMEAPAGRLILPQVQAIRETLDADAASLVVKEKEIDWALSILKQKPDLAITDSQAVLKAASSIPREIPLTTFSILFSRLKGDLESFVQASAVIDDLQHGDKILIAESCTHKTMCDDIGRVKLPRWLKQHSGKTLDIQVAAGDFPEDLEDFKLIIHCGGCMITRKMMLARMGEADTRGLPITNYGIAISKMHGVLPRVLEPFGL